MSSIQGGRAIAAVANGQIEERPYARTFVLRGDTGTVHVVTIGAHADGRAVCTCKAGQAGRECYAVKSAKLLMRKRRDEAGESAVVVDIGGVLHRRVYEPIGTALELIPVEDPDSIVGRVLRDDASTCECYHTCGEDGAGCSHSGDWHVHEGEPCPVHPDATVVG